jgi:hypothetical protein
MSLDGQGLVKVSAVSWLYGKTWLSRVKTSFGAGRACVKCTAMS